MVAPDAVEMGLIEAAGEDPSLLAVGARALTGQALQALAGA